MGIQFYALLFFYCLRLECVKLFLFMNFAHLPRESCTSVCPICMLRSVKWVKSSISFTVTILIVFKCVHCQVYVISVCGKVKSAEKLNEELIKKHLYFTRLFGVCVDCDAVVFVDT